MGNTITIHEINLPDCCKNCSNKPKPGEIKVYHCALPALNTFIW